MEGEVDVEVILVRGDVASCKLVAFLGLFLSSILVPTCCLQMSNLSSSRGTDSLGLGVSD